MRRINVRRIILPLSLLIISLATLTTLPTANAQLLTWAAVTSPTTYNLLSLFCVSANDCWAVGDGGVIIHGTSAPPPAQGLGEAVSSVYSSSAG